jgi:hypothetical protein
MMVLGGLAVMARWIHFPLWTLSFAATALPGFGQDKSPAKPAAGFVDIGDTLQVAAPVNINGPYSDEPRKVGNGDLLLLQIRYPVAPPMPASVAVESGQKHVELVTTARTTAEIAALAREPRAGGMLGISFVQVLVRATSPGKDLLVVKVKRQDGSVKDVPFAIEVK